MSHCVYCKTATSFASHVCANTICQAKERARLNEGAKREYPPKQGTITIVHQLIPP